MIIKKLLNNNAAIIFENEKEVVVMGKGIGFQKEKGDEVDVNKIRKVFKLENKQSNDRLIELIDEIPYEYLQLSEKIISKAEETLEIKLSDSIYLTLTDHINFAIANYRKNIIVRNTLLFDIKRLYKKEFLVALDALKLINETFDTELIEDEAASITLHIINAIGNHEIPEMVEIMNIINEATNIVKYTLKIEFDEDTLSYHRFINHLKFFAERVVSHKFYEDHDLELFDMITAKYDVAYGCGVKIQEFIAKKYGNNITSEEVLYLTVHIERLLQKKA